MEARVKFIDVGRDKQNWEATLPLDSDGCLKHADLVKQVRQKKALMSPNIFFEENGTISAGIRPVGRYEVAMAE